MNLLNWSVGTPDMRTLAVMHGQIQLKMKGNWIFAMGLMSLMTSCYSFDKEVALNEFKELKPNCVIIKMIDYECDGTLGECWYVEFKYKNKGSGTTYDTTFQYWKRSDKWLTSREHDELLR